VKDRRQRKERLRIHLDKSCKNFEVGIKKEIEADNLLSVLEDETRVYNEMDIDGNRNGYRSGDGVIDDVICIDDAIEISSNDDLDVLGDIPSLSL
jgi:hypothetical protein